MRLKADWLEDPRAQAACALLVDAGAQAFFVGGCVRNTLLGTDVSDIDIATNARPDAVMKAAEDRRFHVVPTGIEHGTVTVVIEQMPFEITTFRRDVETDGRRAVIAFADRIEDDALRRDLTMNALYAKPSGDVVDPLGGLQDVLARRIRFIADARARIREDYLRILRFFRFFAWYGDAEHGLDAEGLAACTELADGLYQLSKERIGNELTKLLQSPDPAPAMAAFAQTGGLERILPGATAKDLAGLVQLEKRHQLAPSATRRLASLGRTDFRARLRLRKADAKEVDDIQTAAFSTRLPAEIGYRLGYQTAQDALILRGVYSDAQNLPKDIAAAERGAKATFPISAADIMPRFSGVELGAELRRLEAIWIASDFTMRRDALLSS